MAKYQKKPVVVDAVQWFKEGDHPAVRNAPSHNLTGSKEWPAGTLTDSNGTPAGFIDTIYGGAIVESGDWIVTGTEGETYPIKPIAFNSLYQIVKD